MTLRPRQNGRHFPDAISNCIFFNENNWIPIQISLKFAPMDQINYISALVQIMAWRRSGDKPLSEAMMVSLLTHICATRPQNGLTKEQISHYYKSASTDMNDRTVELIMKAKLIFTRSSEIVITPTFVGNLPTYLYSGRHSQTGDLHRADAEIGRWFMEMIKRDANVFFVYWNIFRTTKMNPFGSLWGLRPDIFGLWNRRFYPHLHYLFTL